MSNYRIVIFLLLLTFLGSIYYLRIKQELTKYANFSQLKQSEKIKQQGRISEQPYHKSANQIIVVGEFRLYTDPFDHYEVGDLIEFSGSVDKRVIRFIKPTFYLFDPTIRRLENSDGEFRIWDKFVLRQIVFISKKLENVFLVSLPEPHASLLAGIVLGAKRSMPEDFYQLLVASGTLHVIAASGFNITIIAKVLLDGLAYFLHRKVAVVIALVGVIFYTLLAGASAAVVRAAIMGGLAFVAQALGKDYLAKWALGLSAAIMLLVDPLLVENVSFQLSVAATAGILWLQEEIERVLFERRVLASTQRVGDGDQMGNDDSSKGVVVGLTANISGVSRFSRDRTRLRVPVARLIQGVKSVIGQDLSTTLAATVATLPITLITFDRISLVSPLVNAISLWLVPGIMAIGGVMSMVGLILPSLTWLVQIMGWLVWPLLEVFIQVVSFFGKLPWASFEVQGLSWVFGMGYYTMLMSLVNLRCKMKRPK